MSMRIYKKAILPRGFKANGVSCGIKRPGKLDLALLYSEFPAIAVCQFTRNAIKAAPIVVSSLRLKANKKFRAILANSGNANCFNAGRGIRDALDTSSSIAKALNIKGEEVLLASTGVIGKRLPVFKIERKAADLVEGLSKEGISRAKKAILTTDVFSKELTVKFNIGRKAVTICGIAKGAGMIAPDMATMLCFILTDANISRRALTKALDIAVRKTFNCITVDGCMSTNDSVMALANGASGCRMIDTKENSDLFINALYLVSDALAKMIVKDAEGATKFIKITVKEAGDFKEAKKAALQIANSSLFKTAMYGENPNFGRIVAAVGASGVSVKENELKIRVSPLKRREISVEVSLGKGVSQAVIYTSDLTPEYVKINAEYN
jgi:glutamate N-acetyltransferase / amino-acid N-acetyltransferase